MKTLFLLLFPLLTFAQKQDSVAKAKEDSAYATRLSLDLNMFNVWLATLQVKDYRTLTPELTINEFWAWIRRGRK